MYGKILKEHRKARQLTQQELSKRTGLTQAQISYYENDINEPNITACIILADFYCISIDDLVGHEIKKNWL